MVERSSNFEKFLLRYPTGTQFNAGVAIATNDDGVIDKNRPWVAYVRGPDQGGITSSFFATEEEAKRFLTDQMMLYVEVQGEA